MCDPWMTSEELAKELKITVQEVRQMRARGTGPPGRRLGKEVRYHRAVVEAWRKCAARGTPAPKHPKNEWEGRT